MKQIVIATTLFLTGCATVGEPVTPPVGCSDHIQALRTATCSAQKAALRPGSEAQVKAWVDLVAELNRAGASEKSCPKPYLMDPCRAP